MDCGDAGHILVSERAADDLRQLGRWSSQLHDLGEAEVKHGFRVHLFNFHTDEVGNPAIPTKLRPAASKFSSKRTAVIAAMAIAAALIGTIAFFAFKPRVLNPGPVTPPVVTAPLREQSLTYWLTVQKMGNDKPVGKPFDSAGDVIFGNGWKFRFNILPAQNGALYLLNEGPGVDNKTEYNVLFPNPADNSGLAALSANQQLNSGWYRFVDQTGVEKLWLVWASEAPPDLDSVFRAAANHAGVIEDVRHIETVQKYLKQYDRNRLEVSSDKGQKRTIMKGKGDLVVGLVELSHEAY
jgi:hypothetical protein